MEPIVSGSFRRASENFFDAVLHLGVGGCDIIGGERQALEDLAVKTESWRWSEPMRVKIGPFQAGRPFQLAQLVLSEADGREETLKSLTAKLARIESSPQTAIISQSAEKFIAQVEKQGSTSQTLVILRKAFAQLAAFLDAGFRF